MIRYSYILDMEKEGFNKKKVKSIDFKLVTENIKGQINITDVQFQEGGYVTGYNIHTTEFTRKMKHTIDEFAFINTVSNPVKDGVQPVVWKDVNNRIYNIVGRGIETMSISNTYHDDYTEDIITSGVDITLIPKDDYDLLRVSTNYGTYIDGRTTDDVYAILEEGEEYPLNWVYTSEYYVGGGKAGDVIQILASEKKAYKNGIDITVGKFRNGIIPMSMQSFMIAGQGSNRYRIEFYKRVTEVINDEGETVTYYKDTGIGYYGWAEIKSQSKMEARI